MSTSLIESLESRTLLSADLVGEITTRLPAGLALPAQENHFSLRVSNEGDTPSTGPVTVSLFASTDTTLDNDDTPLASLTRSARVTEGRAFPVALKFASPTDLTDGEYYLLTEVTSTSGSTVTASAKPVKIQSPFSDVAVSFAALPNRPVEIDGPTSGERGALVKVFNNGNISTTGTAEISLYLSADAVLDSSDPLLAIVPARSLALGAGAARDFGLKIAVPPGTAVGGYFLFAVLTPTGLGDTNINNDVVISSQRVAVVNRLPDLRRELVVYYDGPEYIGDDSGSYGYYEDTYYPPDDGSTQPVDQGGTGTPTIVTPPDTTQPDPTTQPSDGGGNDNTSPTTQPSDPPTATTQPSDPPSGGDNSGSDSGSGNSTGGDDSGGDDGGDSSGGDSGSSDSGSGDSGGDSGGDDSGGDDSGGDDSGGDDGGDYDDSAIARRSLPALAHIATTPVLQTPIASTLDVRGVTVVRTNAV